MSPEAEALLKDTKAFIDWMKEWLKDMGPCDHSVNICYCNERMLLRDLEQSVANFKETEAKK